jgi:hypothetical protein
MQTKRLAIALAFGLLTAGGAVAQTTAPVTATCKDGSAFSGASRSGACRGHGGVGSWGSTTPAASPAKTPDAAPATTTPATTTPATRTPAAAGGGAGQVWVNSSSKVYHCQGDRYYGKTKAGSYMSETAAKAAGDRPAGGKACS